MAARLGNVIYWAACAVAIVPGLVVLFLLYSAVAYGITAHSWELVQLAGLYAALAGVVWLIGRAARYILAGT